MSGVMSARWLTPLHAGVVVIAGVLWSVAVMAGLLTGWVARASSGRAAPDRAVGFWRRASVGSRLLEFGEGAEQGALLADGQGGADDLTFSRVECREQLVDDGPGVGGDVDEELAAIFWVRQPSDQASFLEVVEQ